MACLDAVGAVTTAAAGVEADPDRPGVADTGEDVGGALAEVVAAWAGLVVLPECSATGSAPACSAGLAAVTEGVRAAVCEEEELMAAGASLALLMTIGAWSEPDSLDCAGSVAVVSESVAVAEPDPSSDDARPTAEWPG